MLSGILKSIFGSAGKQERTSMQVTIDNLLEQAYQSYVENMRTAGERPDSYFHYRVASYHLIANMVATTNRLKAFKMALG
jgi:hypothetical protein